MALAPAVLDVFAAVRERVENIDPEARPEVRFAHVEPGVEVRELQIDSCERQFRVRFASLTDTSNEGGGVMTPGLADRVVRLNVEIAYPPDSLDRADDLELELAADAEQVARALGRSADWTGTPVQRAVVGVTRENPMEAEALLLVFAVAVQYRDQE